MAEIENIDKPWGNELILVKNDKYVIKLITVNAGCRLSKQFHRKKIETLIPLNGQARVEIANPIVHIEHGYFQPLTILPGEIHRVMARKYNGDTKRYKAQILEVSTPELSDVVRIEDDYKRDNE